MKAIQMLKKLKRPLILEGYEVRASNSVNKFQIYFKS